MPILTFSSWKDRHTDGTTTLVTAAGPVGLGESGNFTAQEQIEFGKIANLDPAANVNVVVAKPATPFKLGSKRA